MRSNIQNALKHLLLRFWAPSITHHKYGVKKRCSPFNMNILLFVTSLIFTGVTAYSKQHLSCGSMGYKRLEQICAFCADLSKHNRQVQNQQPRVKLACIGLNANGCCRQMSNVLYWSLILFRRRRSTEFTKFTHNKAHLTTYRLCARFNPGNFVIPPIDKIGIVASRVVTEKLVLHSLQLVDFHVENVGEPGRLVLGPCVETGVCFKNKVRRPWISSSYPW